jgi:hypothetical protein
MSRSMRVEMYFQICVGGGGGRGGVRHASDCSVDANVPSCYYYYWMDDGWRYDRVYMSRTAMMTRPSDRLTKLTRDSLPDEIMTQRIFGSPLNRLISEP